MNDEASITIKYDRHRPIVLTQDLIWDHALAFWAMRSSPVTTTFIGFHDGEVAEWKRFAALSPEDYEREAAPGGVSHARS